MKRLFGVILVIVLLTNFVDIPISVPYFGYEKVEAATLELNKTKVSLYVGETFILSVKETTKSIKWTTSDYAVATVTKKGKVTAHKKGSVTITATIGTMKLNCFITVNKTMISSVDLELELASSSSLSLLGVTKPVTWSSSDNTVATVTKNGVVFARAVGTAQITGRYKGLSYHCKVTVGYNKIHASITNLTCYEDTVIAISVRDLKEDEVIKCEAGDTKIVKCNMGEWSGNSYPLNIKPIGYGTTTITITSNKSEEILVIKVTAIDKSKNTGIKFTSEEIYEKCTSATVQVNTDIGIGSGFFIDNGIVVTNYHVIKDASTINVQLLNGEKYDAEYVVGFNRELDIAVLCIPTVNSILTINRHGIKAGETIYTLGSSLGLADTFTNGIISNASRLIDDVNFIQINAAITFGNSGGPLINSYGEVIGINTAGIEEGQNLNFAVNIKQLYQVSTGNPIPITEFNKLEKEYKKLLEIQEDPALSCNTRLCQNIPSGSTVYGSCDSINIDTYQFTISKDRNVSIVCGPSSEKSDLELLDIMIVDSNNIKKIWIAKTENMEGEPLKSLNCNLSRGTYWILVREYSFEKIIPYYFKIIY